MVTFTSHCSLVLILDNLVLIIIPCTCSTKEVHEILVISVFIRVREKSILIRDDDVDLLASCLHEFSITLLLLFSHIAHN